jgi:hypothetical protein
MPEQTNNDLTPYSELNFDWNSGHAEESLNKVYLYSTQLAKDTIGWYISAKKKKKKGARIIRVLSIILAALAAILPTLSELFQHKNGTTVIRAGWTTVALAVAGSLLLLDRFFGFSSAWIRYIVAELQVKQINEEFQMDWETERAGWQGNPPTREQIIQMLAPCKAFVSQVNNMVRDETNAWVQEFQSSIKYIDDTLKAGTRPPEPGALNINIINGEIAKDGWKLKVDNGDTEIYMGKSAAKKNLTPGNHLIRIEALIENKAKLIEKVVIIPAGNTCTETFTF